MSLAAVAGIVAAGAITYGAVSASDTADANRRSVNLNTEAGRKLAEKLAKQQAQEQQVQHDDLVRQLNEQTNEFKAKLALAQTSENSHQQVALVAAGLVGLWLFRKKK